MENNLKAIVSTVIFVMCVSCNISSERTGESQSILSDTSQSNNKIVYVLDDSISRFINDSIYSVNDKITSCKISSCNGVTEMIFGYEDDSYSPVYEFLIRNSSRFILTNGRLIPVVFNEDYRFIDYKFFDMTKAVSKTTNWMNYAVLKFNTRNEVIEYRNYYKEIGNKMKEN